MKEILFKINDFQYKTSDKLTIIQACLENKIDIPRFCYHEKLSIAGNCRMCLVEDLKQVKPIASCAINLSDSMIIYTNTLKVKKARESVLEFLLANHPLDCPICDQGGECDLQDQSIVFGGDRGRFYEYKRSVEDKDCGPLVKTIMNRCIHCTRCVRFSVEVAGHNFLGITGRGSKMEIGFYIENFLNNELSGNIIDLCPVGALTSKVFAFSARSWELKNYNTIDILDSLGSNIRVDVRGTKIMRIIPRINNNINEDWITDKIRFCYDSLRRQRLYNPLIRIKQNFIKLSWKKVFVFLKIIFKKYIIKLLQKKQKYLNLKAYIGNFIDIETLLLTKNFLSKLGNVSTINTNINNDFREYYSFNLNISDINNSELCLLINTYLRLDVPLLNAKIRQNFIKNKMLVYNLSFYSNFNYYVKNIGFNLNILINIIEGLHWICNKFIISKNPLIVISNNNNILQNEILYIFFNKLQKYTKVFCNNWYGLNILNTNISDFGKNELNLTNSIHNQNTNYNIFQLYYLIGYDNNINFNLKKKNNIIIYQGHHGDISVNFSDIILPSTVFIEKNSTFFNFQGVLQKNKKILFNLNNSRDDWKIINAIGEILQINLNFKNSLSLYNKLLNITPYYSNNIKFKLYNNNIIFKFFYNTRCFFYNNLFLSIQNNYYNMDTYSRMSKVLSLCSIKFKTKSYNFINNIK